MIRIRVNGEIRELPEAVSIAGLLEILAIEKKMIAVELNREIVGKSYYETTVLKDGDTVEIVKFVGGG